MELSNQVLLEKTELSDGMPLLLRKTSAEFCDNEHSETAKKMSNFYKNLTDRALEKVKQSFVFKNESSDSRYCHLRSIIISNTYITYQDAEYVSVMHEIYLRRGAKKVNSLEWGAVWRKKDAKLCPARLFDRKAGRYNSFILDGNGGLCLLSKK